jgi:hypothetical protein
MIIPGMLLVLDSFRFGQSLRFWLAAVPKVTLFIIKETPDGWRCRWSATLSAARSAFRVAAGQGSSGGCFTPGLLLAFTPPLLTGRI